MNRPQVLIACSERVRHGYLSPEELTRLEQVADWAWFACEGGNIYHASEDAEATAQLAKEMGAVDALVICHGAPRIGESILAAAPRLRLIGELEGDRFATRIDLDAAWARGIRTVDTTNGSSYPVAEWALALTLIAMRNAGALFRRILARNTDRSTIEPMAGMLTGKRVGLIGGGHMGRRLMKLLRPFEVELWVHDPYLPQELAEALGFLLTSLDNVLSQCDAIVCVAPLTPQTEGMIGLTRVGAHSIGSGFGERVARPDLRLRGPDRAPQARRYCGWLGCLRPGADPGRQRNYRPAQRVFDSALFRTHGRRIPELFQPHGR